MDNENKTKIYGYARVSTLCRDIGNQRNRLEKEGCHHIFYDKISGKGEKANMQIQLQALLDTINAGDTVIVTNISRLSGGGILGILEVMYIFREKRIKLVCLDSPYMGIDYSKEENYSKEKKMIIVDDLYISMMTKFTTLEWELAEERQQNQQAQRL